MYTLTQATYVVHGFALATGLLVDIEKIRRYLSGNERPIQVYCIDKNDVALYDAEEVAEWLKSARSQKPLKELAASTRLVAFL